MSQTSRHGLKMIQMIQRQNQPIMLKHRPLEEPNSRNKLNSPTTQLEEIDELPIRSIYKKSESCLSRAHSQASFSLKQIDNQRIAMFNSDLILKLSYQWKNCYRSLLSSDVFQKGFVSIRQLNQVLESHNVRLTQEEIRRLVKMSRGSRGNSTDLTSQMDLMEQKVDYKQLSKNMGLQSNALNLMQGHELNRGSMGSLLPSLSKLNTRSQSHLRSADVTPKNQLIKRNISIGQLLSPIKSARIGAGPIQQVIDLCKLTDKERTGKVKIHSFMRILKATGLKVDNIQLMKFTNERENVVDFSALTNELLKE